jgi:hypothetical protein
MTGYQTYKLCNLKVDIFVVKKGPTCQLRFTMLEPFCFKRKARCA